MIIYINDNKSCIYIFNNGEVHLSNISIKEFLKINPPCKGCLIQGICLQNDYYTKSERYIKIISCDNLRQFLNNKYE